MQRLMMGCAVVALALGAAGSAAAQADQAQVQAQASLTPVQAEQQAGVLAALDRRLTDAASAYETYERSATAIDARFRDAAAVRSALRAGSAYEPRQLQEGVVAYAALLALRDPEFVDGVRAMQGSGLAERLVVAPQAVLAVPGAQQAARDAAGVLDMQGSALIASGKAITQAAYDVQHQSWSTAFVRDQAEVLREAKAAAEHPRSADAPAEKLLLASIAAAPAAAPRQASPTSPQVVRGLAVAALVVLGRAGESADADVERLLFDSVNADCFKLARLTLNECLAAAGPSYEDAFCLGRHAIGDASQCIVSALDTAPAAPEPRLTTASLETYGPERQAYERSPRYDEQMGDRGRWGERPAQAAEPGNFGPAPGYAPPEGY